MEAIKVSVVEFGDRKHYQMQYRDPITRRKQTKSTGIERTGLKRERTEAERVAAKWESELREGRYHAPSKVTWAEFRQRYEDEVLTSLAESTDKKVTAVFNTVERHLNPDRLADMTAQRISALQAKLREDKRTENTIKSHMAHLAAALAWAVRMGMLSTAPRIDMPRRAKASKIMKGRPLAGEEFDRLLASVEKIVGIKAAPSWQRYLQGLWTSGLRLGESLELCWDRDDKLCIDLSCKRPMLRIPAALEKGNQDRLLPVAPEFAEWLLEVPEANRMGYVFSPGPQRPGRSERLAEGTVCHTISRIGEKAGIKVNSKTSDDGTETVKFASAHDLRRSFGARWASRVMPQVLMELMRHESIETTLKYYVGKNAQSTADVLWAAVGKADLSGNTSGNSGQKSAPEAGQADLPKSLAQQEIE